MTTLRVFLAGLFIAGRMTAFAPAEPMPQSQSLKRGKPSKIGYEAYIYGYPLVTMEMTRRVMTNTETPKSNHAPMGQFYHAKTYPDAAFRGVTAPNADTLYSFAWLDLVREPYILSLPDEGDRYFLIPMLDAWTDVFQVPGEAHFHRDQGPKVRHHRAELEGRVARRRQGTEVAHEHGVDPRPHLLHRYEGRLQGGT